MELRINNLSSRAKEIMSLFSQDLKEFISKNDGKLSVLSDQGYWEWSSGRERTREFTCSFAGTGVTIVINMDDPQSYRMASEGEN